MCQRFALFSTGLRHEVCFSLRLNFSRFGSPISLRPLQSSNAVERSTELIVDVRMGCSIGKRLSYGIDGHKRVNEAHFSRRHLQQLRYSQQKVPDKVVCNYPENNLLLRYTWILAVDHIHLKSRLQISQVKFNAPASYKHLNDFLSGNVSKSCEEN